MSILYLEDLKEYDEAKIRQHLIDEYGAPNIDHLEILIAYESVGSWGCDSTSFFLLKDKDGVLYENHGSHCSCYGFEEQWKPEPTTIEYLKSDKFRFYTGGYDDNEKENTSKILNYIKNL